MKIYRRVIPKIAKDIVRTLLANRAIEIDTGDGMRWRHRELHVCLANAERLALADLLLGGRKQP